MLAHRPSARRGCSIGGWSNPRPMTYAAPAAVVAWPAPLAHSFRIAGLRAHAVYMNSLHQSPAPLAYAKPDLVDKNTASLLGKDAILQALQAAHHLGVGLQLRNHDPPAAPADRAGHLPGAAAQGSDRSIAVHMATLRTLDGVLEASLRQLADERLVGRRHDNVRILLLIPSRQLLQVSRQRVLRMARLLPAQ